MIALFWGGLQGIPSLEAWGLTIALAIIPTVVANITLVEGVKLIGSTMSAILGALEPLTAVVIGFLVFDEVLTPLRLVGILLRYSLLPSRGVLPTSSKFRACARGIASPSAWFRSDRSQYREIMCLSCSCKSAGQFFFTLESIFSWVECDLHTAQNFFIS